jgi:hypothetical protein
MLASVVSKTQRTTVASRSTLDLWWLDLINVCMNIFISPSYKPMVSQSGADAAQVLACQLQLATPEMHSSGGGSGTSSLAAGKSRRTICQGALHSWQPAWMHAAYSRR